MDYVHRFDFLYLPKLVKLKFNLEKHYLNICICIFCMKTQPVTKFLLMYLPGDLLKRLHFEK